MGPAGQYTRGEGGSPRAARPQAEREPGSVILGRLLEDGGSIEGARFFAFAGARPGPDLDFVRSLVDFLVGRDA